MEEKSAEYYGDIAITFIEHHDFFKDLAKENLKHRDRVIRAYRQGVSDAFEVGFNPNPINPDQFTIKAISSNNLNEILETLVQNEETIALFCEVASKSSGELLPDLPDTLEYIIRKKRQRIQQLNSMKA
jgi:hypothetical protein